MFDGARGPLIREAFNDRTNPANQDALILLYFGLCGLSVAMPLAAMAQHLLPQTGQPWLQVLVRVIYWLLAVAFGALSGIFLGAAILAFLPRPEASGVASRTVSSHRRRPRSTTVLACFSLTAVCLSALETASIAIGKSSDQRTLTTIRPNNPPSAIPSATPGKVSNPKRPLATARAKVKAKAEAPPVRKSPAANTTHLTTPCWSQTLQDYSNVIGANTPSRLANRWGGPVRPVGSPITFEVRVDPVPDPTWAVPMRIVRLTSSCLRVGITVNPGGHVRLKSFVGEEIQSFWTRTIAYGGTTYRRAGDLNVSCIAGIEQDSGCSKVSMTANH